MSRSPRQKRAVISPSRSPSPTRRDRRWYDKVVALYGPEIEYSDDVSWEAVYHLLYPVYNLRNPFTAEVLQNPNAVLVLIQAGYDPTKGDNWPIQLAATRGYTKTVRILLEDGRADPEGTLIMAAENGHSDVVLLLLRDGRISDREIMEAREVAADNSHDAIVDMLY